MPRYAPAMSQADLRQIVIDKAIASDYIEEYGDLNPSSPDMTSLVHMLLMEDLVPEVEKDWSKIDFSTENMDVTAEKVTPGGVPYLLIRAGGDWEAPLQCIVYFDGKKLRGYVPKDGNSYNFKAKAAFGNNDSDAAEATKQFGRPITMDDLYRGVEPNMDLIEQDIANRIEAKGSYSYDSKPVVSKAQTKAAKQAEIEKDQDLSGDITADMVYAVISLAAGGSYVEFELRSSRRELTTEEGARVVGVPNVLDRHEGHGGGMLWYGPMGCYPMQMLALLEKAGFEKAPDNEIGQYAGARTIVIR